MKKRTTLVLVISALATVLTGVMAGQAQAGSALGSDCAVLGPIGSNAVPTLAPLQNMPQSQAAPKLNAYLGQLRGQEGRLTTAQGKADLQAYIDALQNATSPSAAPQIMAAINKLQTDCPT
ncbi:hypothetical protein ABIA39_004108 [Nocardia sp. GAS34]|uniref:hypothetical protein n=1 Tax=unclassified Nocardia TaxID=2637762 RepID=UPI003D1F727A